MQQRNTRRTLIRFSLSALVLVVVAIATVLIITQHNRTGAAPSVKPGIGAAVPSKFSFTGTMGWWQRATRETDMALFHPADSCFISVQYKSGTVDEATELQKLTLSQASINGTSAPGTVLPMTLQTIAGPVQYQLHQYTLTPPAGVQLLRGFELGFVQLSGNYIQVEGHCDTPDQLSATIPALQAIKFDANK